MAPPQVNLNEKPRAEASEGGGEPWEDVSKKEALLCALTSRYNDLAHDPLPEKKEDVRREDAIIVTVDTNRRRTPISVMSGEQRRQRRRCRIACCASLSFLLVLLMALGTACLVYRMKHRKHMRVTCGTQDGDMLPEHVRVDHDNQLIYVKPEHHSDKAMEMLHEYNRRLIAFKNGTAKVCYLDRLDETFADGYARWQGYAEGVYLQNHTLKVFPQKIDVEVVKHIADVHIFEHCGQQEYEYHWVMEVTQEEVRLSPADKYITV